MILLKADDNLASSISKSRTDSASIDCDDKKSSIQHLYFIDPLHGEFKSRCASQTFVLNFETTGKEKCNVSCGMNMRVSKSDHDHTSILQLTLIG